MNNKKDQLLFVVKVCVAFFAITILCSFIYYLIIGAKTFPIVLIEQWLFMDAFLFTGMLFGATDIIIKIRSTILRSSIVTVILYIAAMLILSNMKWNPLENALKFFSTTFLFICAAFIVTSIYVMWQKSQSRKYIELIELFKTKHITSE